MAASSEAQAVRAPERRSSDWWSAWPRRTEIGATGESKELLANLGHEDRCELSPQGFAPFGALFHHQPSLRSLPSCGAAAQGPVQGVAGTSEYVICHIYMRHRFCWG